MGAGEGALGCCPCRGPAHVWLREGGLGLPPTASGSSRCSGRSLRASCGGPARLWSPLRPHWPWLSLEHPPGLQQAQGQDGRGGQGGLLEVDLPVAHLRVCLLRGEGRLHPRPAVLASQAPHSSGPGSLSFACRQATGRAAARSGRACMCACVSRRGCDLCDALPPQQTSEPSHPDIILIAINRHGVLLIHPKTKVAEGPGRARGGPRAGRLGSCPPKPRPWALEDPGQQFRPGAPHASWALAGSDPPTCCGPRTCSPPTPSPRSPAGAAAVPTSTWCWGAWAGAAACCVRPLW